MNTKETTTLEAVRDWHRTKALNSLNSELRSQHPGFCERDAAKHNEMADAIDAHLVSQPAEQPRGEVTNKRTRAQCETIMQESIGRWLLVNDRIWKVLKVDYLEGWRPVGEQSVQVTLEFVMGPATHHKLLRGYTVTIDELSKHFHPDTAGDNRAYRKASAKPMPEQAVGDGVAFAADDFYAGHPLPELHDDPQTNAEIIIGALIARLDVARRALADAAAMQVISPALAEVKKNAAWAMHETDPRRLLPRSAMWERPAVATPAEVTDETIREWCERHEIFSLGSHLTDARAAFEDAKSIASPSAGAVVPEGWLNALDAAVSAIYFDDSSKYLRALWTVVRSLKPDIADRLESYAPGAYDEVQAMLAAAPEVDRG